jgi:hypothetical protein
MRAPGVVTADPRLQYGPQMRFSQGNQPIEALPTNGPDHSFANRIGLWTSRWRFQHRDAELRDRLVKMVRKDTVTIVKQVFVTVLKSNGLTQLLQRPGSTRMRCDVAMDQAPAAVLDHHEHVQQPKRGGDGDQEIAGNDPLGMQAQERRPAQVPSRSTRSDAATDTCSRFVGTPEFPTSPTVHWLCVPDPTRDSRWPFGG